MMAVRGAGTGKKGGYRPINHQSGTSLVVQGLRLCFPMQGVWVQSLVRERKSHVPRSQKMETLKEKQKQYCNKFTKYFKMVHIKKKNHLSIKMGP